LECDTNIRLGWKGFSETNALAYYEKLQLTSVKSFITLTPVANVMKLFTVVSYDFS
jgi:hypothetical protein